MKSYICARALNLHLSNIISHYSYMKHTIVLSCVKKEEVIWPEGACLSCKGIHLYVVQTQVQNIVVSTGVHPQSVQNDFHTSPSSSLKHSICPFFGPVLSWRKPPCKYRISACCHSGHSSKSTSYRMQSGHLPGTRLSPNIPQAGHVAAAWQRLSPSLSPQTTQSKSCRRPLRQAHT